MDLSWLLRSMLENAAREKVRQQVQQKVVEAAQEQFAPQAAGAAEAAADDRRCDVAVVCALPMESDALEERLTDVVQLRGHGFLLRRGLLRDRHVAVVISGPGRAAAASATEAFLQAYRPQWLISAGFAGGLHEDLPRQHLLVAEMIGDLDGRWLPVDLRRFPPKLLDLEPVHVGKLLTVDRIIRHEQEKRLLGVSHKALAVDMESLAVAEVCRRRETPFLAVRVISDAVDDELPADVDRLLQQKSKVGRLGAAFGAILNRPGSLKDMFQLQQAALAAGTRLAKYLTRVVGGIGIRD